MPHTFEDVRPRAGSPGPGPSPADELARSGFTVRGDLGQHFLRSAEAARRLLECAALAQGAEVLEVGAGLGTLSAEIAGAGYRIWAVEKDERLGAGLLARLAPFGERARVSVADVRDLDLDAGLDGEGVLVAILPFDAALAGALARHVFAAADGIERGLLVVPDPPGALGGGLRVEEVDGISRAEFWPKAPGMLRVVAVRRAR
ncbi:rRNA adenine N-6-methyltransferase family protein [Streptomyces sp. NPDC057638]|uniref:rRNA adenine N-6-methyltransferase family protein n=1 Tax=Streptomyces sp. NPDC057638 TaxID=3346190 RepID=UPI00367982FD